MSTENIVDQIGKLVEGPIAEVRDELKAIVDSGSAREAELKAQLDLIHTDYLTLQEAKTASEAKMDSLQTALNRIGAKSESEIEASENSEYKAAFEGYLRKNNPEDALRALEVKLMQVGSDPDGGVRVPEDVTNRVIQQVYETSAMRPVATVQQTSKMEVVVFQDLDEAGGGWEDEAQTQSETSTPELGKIKIPVHKVTAEPHATEEMLADADFGLEAWLSGKVASKLARLENTAFVNGTGSGQPRGFLTYAAGTDLSAQQIEQLETAASSTFDEDDLTAMIGALKMAYRQNATWAMGRQTHKNLFTLKDTNGNWLFDPVGLRNGELWGYGVSIFEDMVAPTSGVTYADGVKPIAFGDFREGYMIAERQGLRTLVDPYTTKGRVKYYTTKRIGGGVVNFEAIKVMDIKDA